MLRVLTVPGVTSPATPPFPADAWYLKAFRVSPQFESVACRMATRLAFKLPYLTVAQVTLPGSFTRLRQVYMQKDRVP